MLISLAYPHPAECFAATRDQPEEVALSASFGFDGVLVPDRWCPVRIAISQPGGRPLTTATGGTLIIRYTQDATQKTELLLAVATTPGRVSVIEGAVCVPRHCARIEVEFLDFESQRASKQVYAQNPDDERGELPMPPIASLGCLSVVGDGSALLTDRLLKDWRPRSDDFDPALRVRFSQARSELLPAAPIAYDSVDVLVLDAETELSAQVAVAIRQWVRSGGRLALVAARGGAGWKTWLTDLGIEPVAIGEPVSLPLPASMLEPARTKVGIKPKRDMNRGTSGNANLTLPVIVNPDGSVAPAPPTADEAGEATEEDESADAATVPGNSADQSSKPEKPRPPVELASSAPQRLITLTPRGEFDGWRLRWLADGAPDRGLLAEGPVGLGRVVVLGVHPTRAVRATDETSNTAEDAQGLWKDALQSLDVPPRVGTGERIAAFEYDYSLGSGPNGRAARALSAALDSMVLVQPIQWSVFIVIAIAMLALAGFVGPVDYLVLRNPIRRRWSWLTALGWISLASVLAYFGPIAVRESTTSIGRLSVIDAVQGATKDEPTLAVATSITSIWSGISQEATALVPLAGDGASPQPPQPLAERVGEASWWRGVSGVQLPWRSDEGTMLPSASFVQRPPAIAAGAAAPIVAGQGGTTAPAPRGLSLRRWTLRNYMDESPVECPVLATPMKQPGGLALRLAIPAGANIKEACVLTREGWGVLKVEPDGSSKDASRVQSLTARLPGEFTALDPGAEIARFAHYQSEFDDSFDFPEPAPPPSQAPTIRMAPWAFWQRAAAFDLPGVPRRDAPGKDRIATGRWIALYLWLENMPMDLTLDSPGLKSRRDAVVRLLVPLEQAP